MWLPHDIMLGALAVVVGSTRDMSDLKETELMNEVLWLEVHAMQRISFSGQENINSLICPE
jgi:hypothetical protein